MHPINASCDIRCPKYLSSIRSISFESVIVICRTSEQVNSVQTSGLAFLWTLNAFNFDFFIFILRVELIPNIFSKLNISANLIYVLICRSNLTEKLTKKKKPSLILCIRRTLKIEENNQKRTEFRLVHAIYIKHILQVT